MNTASDGSEPDSHFTQRIWPLLIVAAGVLVGILLHSSFGRVGSASHLDISEQVVRWPRDTFIAANWRAADETERHRYYHDLIEQHILEGKSVGDLIDLLGPPSTRVPEPPEGWDRLEYLIAPGGQGSGPVSLAVYVDDVTDTIVRVRIKKAHETALPAEGDSP